MAVEVDGPLEHAVLLRQRYATVKHAGLGQKRESALITERTETAWYVVTDEGVIYGKEFVFVGERLKYICVEKFYQKK